MRHFEEEKQQQRLSKLPSYEEVMKEAKKLPPKDGINQMVQIEIISPPSYSQIYSQTEIV